MKLVNEKAEKERVRLIEQARIRALNREEWRARATTALVWLPWALIPVSLVALFILASHK